MVTSVRTFVLVSAHSAHHIVITRVTIGWLQASATKWAYPDFVAARGVAGVYIRPVCFPKAPLFASFVFPCYWYLLHVLLITIRPQYIYPHIRRAENILLLFLLFLLFILLTKSRFKRWKKGKILKEYDSQIIYGRYEGRPRGFWHFSSPRSDYSAVLFRDWWCSKCLWLITCTRGE